MGGTSTLLKHAPFWGSFLPRSVKIFDKISAILSKFLHKVLQCDNSLNVFLGFEVFTLILIFASEELPNYWESISFFSSSSTDTERRGAQAQSL